MDLPAKPEKKIDRKALEKIIQRAAELQANERDLGDDISEDDLLSLGEDVGIPKRLMRQAMLEVQTRVDTPGIGGIVPWLFGPTRISASRVIRRDAHVVEQEMNHWMKNVELLSVKRRFTDSTSWEPRKDVLSTIKRAFATGGRGYKLAKVEEIVAEVTMLEPETCHVSLVANISNLRKQRAVGTTVLAVSGGLVSGVAFALGFAETVAMLPAGLGLATGFASTRVRQSEPEKVQVALEQILDRLEHAEIKLNSGTRSEGALALRQAVDEIKRLPDIISKKLKS